MYFFLPNKILLKELIIDQESERDAITDNPIYSQMHRNTISFLNIMSELSWKEVDYLQAIKNENIIAEMKEREGTLNTAICNLEKDVFKSKQEYDKLTAKLEELQVISTTTLLFSLISF